MNQKTVGVALVSALFAAGFTYWAVSPGRSSERTVTQAKVEMPAPPPILIPAAGPQPEPEVVKGVPPASKPSPTGIAAMRHAPAVEEEPVITATPSKPVEPSGQVATPQPEPVAPPPPNPAPAPPVRVALNPPKEIDRVEPAVIRDRPAQAPNTVTINAGTFVAVRIGETLSVQKNLTGDTFFATLDQPLVAGGFVIAEKGARVEGKIVEVDKAGRMSGTSRMSLELTQVNTSDGQRVHLQTSTYTKDGADRSRKNDAAKIGGGAILGAIIGAAAGGGKGAAVGAGAGGAAGTGAVLLSGGRNVTIPVETKLSFRIEQPVIITERVVQ